MVTIEKEEFHGDMKQVLKLIANSGELSILLRKLGREPEDINAFYNTLFELEDDEDEEDIHDCDYGSGRNDIESHNRDISARISELQSMRVDCIDEAIRAELLQSIGDLSAMKKDY